MNSCHSAMNLVGNNQTNMKTIISEQLKRLREKGVDTTKSHKRNRIESPWVGLTKGMVVES